MPWIEHNPANTSCSILSGRKPVAREDSSSTNLSLLIYRYLYNRILIAIQSECEVFEAVDFAYKRNYRAGSTRSRCSGNELMNRNLYDGNSPLKSWSHCREQLIYASLISKSGVSKFDYATPQSRASRPRRRSRNQIRGKNKEVKFLSGIFDTNQKQNTRLISTEKARRIRYLHLTRRPYLVKYI